MHRPGPDGLSELADVCGLVHWGLSKLAGAAGDDPVLDRDGLGDPIHVGDVPVRGVERLEKRKMRWVDALLLVLSILWWPIATLIIGIRFLIRGIRSMGADHRRFNQAAVEYLRIIDQE